MLMSEKLLSALPADALKAASERDLAKGTLLFAQGARPKAMYCVLHGEIRLVRTSSAGADIILQRSRGGFIAEASLDQASYHCNAVVIEQSRVLAIPRNTFQEALATAHFRDAWIGYVSAELRRARAQSERLMLRTARERICHFIETEGRNDAVKLNFTKKAWAAELGLTHEALYRALASMIAAGELFEPRPGLLSLVK
jgi:CRP-like cAMP-binding protein